MLRISSIILAIYFFAGSTILPNGDFGLLSQVSKLYDSFVQINGSATFDEFLAEELLDPYSIPDDDTKDEPFEKECHTVPIDVITVSANSSFIAETTIIEFPSEPEPAITYIQ